MFKLNYIKVSVIISILSFICVIALGLNAVNLVKTGNEIMLDVQKLGTTVKIQHEVIENQKKQIEVRKEKEKLQDTIIALQKSQMETLKKLIEVKDKKIKALENK